LGDFKNMFKLKQC